MDLSRVNKMLPDSYLLQDFLLLRYKNNCFRKHGLSYLLIWAAVIVTVCSYATLRVDPKYCMSRFPSMTGEKTSSQASLFLLCVCVCVGGAGDWIPRGHSEQYCHISSYYC